MADKEKTCFVIGPIGAPDSDIRTWSDTILECIIEPAVEACGYLEPVRADKISQTGMITLQILEHLVADDLVIADLSSANPNVYYELAVRQAVKKAFVQLIKEDEDIFFDLKDMRTISISDNAKIAKRAAEELIQYIPEAQKLGANIITPISVVTEFQLMRQSDDQQQRTLADVLVKLEVMSAQLNRMDRAIQWSSW